MASFDNLVAYFPSSFSSIFHALSPLMIYDNLLELYLNPLYLFPIIGVLFTGLMIHIFGFTSSSKHPPSVHLFSNGKDKRWQLIKKKKKDERKETKVIKNGSIHHVDLNKSLKSQIKVTSGNENSKKAPSTSTPKNTLNKSTSHKTAETKLLKDNSKKLKSVESQEKLKQDNDNNGGEWIEAVSRKRKAKNRIQANKKAEEKIYGKTNDTSQVGLSTPKSKKVKKENENVNNNKKESLPKMTPSKSNKKDLEKEGKIEKSKHSPTSKLNESGLIIEDPDHYAFEAKEARSSKKAKSLNQKSKKVSELSKPAPIPNEAKKPQADKITAAIITNYEKDGNDADSKKAKKKPNKKKSSSGEEKSGNKNEKMSKTGQSNIEANKTKLPVKLPQPVSTSNGTRTDIIF